MSPIGRVFIIVNLVLAGAFIGFAGTFLQNHTNWKVQFDAEVAARAEEQIAAQVAETQLRDDLNSANQSLTATSGELESTRTQLAAASAENDRLSSQLDTMEGNLNQVSANTAEMRSSIDTAFQTAQDAFQSSIAAQQERDTAVQEREAAVANLRDANFQSSQLQDQIQALNAQVADLTGQIREKDIFLADARAKGYIETMATPDLRGVVSVVGAAGRLVTVSITENPTGAEIQPGIRFAIYSGETYKGDVQVSSVDGTFAFGRVITVPGVAIEVGDRAATQLN